MDELEFRRRLLSNPASQDADLTAQLRQDPTRQQLQQELLQLDQQIAAALSVTVPADLADRLIFRQQLENHRRQPPRWWLGLAAAVVLGSTALITADHWYPWPMDLADHALAHVYHEDFRLTDTEHSQPLQSANTLLADFGIKLNTWPGAIRYADYCDFQGTRSLHLIMDTPEGPLTVFVLPKAHGWQQRGEFSDLHYHGRSMQLAKADVVLVSNKQMSLQRATTLLQQQLQPQGQFRS